MTVIKKRNISQIGFDFVSASFLQAEENEYTIRLSQSKTTNKFRALTNIERAVLLANNNISSDWSQVYVTDNFIPEQILNSKFYGMVRIGNMSACSLAYRDLELPIGIYNSTIISSDIGDDVAIHHVRYMSHFSIGNDIMLSSINEMETSEVAKFGNGLVKEGESEASRIVLELCNENGGRSVIPFDGMQTTDAYLWTRFRADSILQDRFKQLTENQFSNKRGYYSTIGDHCVIKNSNIIKDVKIGSHAYIKGVNKLKNLTVNSNKDSYTQIGEGCELVNGIIGFGCRIFYGVKAVRFVLSSFSQLKYGARLINSFLGDNSTISCCEVLNSLLFPAHEQHHNNSFLCAALIKGQSNMAAGATVGSNHNSRSADGEIIAGRGFWPGLCVSLKHNSQFASYALIVKGDFLHELDVKTPFSLVSLDAAQDQLLIVPGYWFLYNMYALMRNTSKFQSRDKRGLKNQYFEYDVLAPDTINEMFVGISEIAYSVGKTYSDQEGKEKSFYTQFGMAYLANGDSKFDRIILADNIEASKRKVIISKAKEGYSIYKRMIGYYTGTLVLEFLKDKSIADLESFMKDNKIEREYFENLGSQLVPASDFKALITNIKNGSFQEWNQIHAHYHLLSAKYLKDKFIHALASYAELMGISVSASWNTEIWVDLLQKTKETKHWIMDEIYKSRAKDYNNPYRLMVYESYEEMENVIGKFEDNSFINTQRKEVLEFDQLVEAVLHNIN